MVINAVFCLKILGPEYGLTLNTHLNKSAHSNPPPAGPLTPFGYRMSNVTNTNTKSTRLLISEIPIQRCNRTKDATAKAHCQCLGARYHSVPSEVPW